MNYECVCKKYSFTEEEINKDKNCPYCGLVYMFSFNSKTKKKEIIPVDRRKKEQHD